MAIYLVTWDLNKEKPHYAQARVQFLSALDEYESTKDQGLDSVRFVSTSWTAYQVGEHLRKALDDNDRLVVTLVSRGTHHGWLTKTVWDWINARL